MKNIYEVFDEIDKAETPEHKVLILKYNDSKALREVLRGTFDPNITFSIKEIPNYKRSDSPPGLGYTSIAQELDRVYLFQEGNPRVSSNLSLERKRQILIQILENMEAKEAEIYANMLMKKQNVKGLSENIVREAFPGLIVK